MLSWSDIEEGLSLPAVSYVLTSDMVERYRHCVDHATAAYPTIAGRHPAMAFDALVPETILGLPNVGQESQYFNPPLPGKKLTVKAKILRKYSKRNKDYVVVEARTLDEDNRLIEVTRLIALRNEATDLPFAHVAGKSVTAPVETSTNKTAVASGAREITLVKRVPQDRAIAFESAVWERQPNPHSDPDRARALGLDGLIVSGQMLMAYIHELLDGNFGKSWTNGGRISIRYLLPVEPGGSVTVRGRQRGDARKLDIEVLDDTGRRVAVATAFLANSRDAVAAAGASKPAPGPLAGIRVLEFTHAWAGPYAGMILADLGADVIKVERPDQEKESRGGYPYVAGESVPFLALHRNKRSLTLDLKHDSGKAVLNSLLEKADVVVQNFRPSAIERLGIDYDSVTALKPDIVYLSLSGYGSTGAAAERPGVNLVAQASSGICLVSQVDGKPKPVLGPLCDVVAGVWGALGVLSGLLKRERTGAGGHVDVSLVDAGLSLMHYAMFESYYSNRSDSQLSSEMNAPADLYRGSDGRWFAVFASYPALWTRMCQSLGLTELAEDVRFRTRELRTENAAALNDVLEAIFATRESGEWVDALVAAGVPASHVLDISEALGESSLSASSIALLQHRDDIGTFPGIGNPVRWSDRAGLDATVAPTLGAHSAEILGELGLSAAAIDRLRADQII